MEKNHLCKQYQLNKVQSLINQKIINQLNTDYSKDISKNLKNSEVNTQYSTYNDELDNAKQLIDKIIEKNVNQYKYFKELQKQKGIKLAQKQQNNPKKSLRFFQLEENKKKNKYNYKIYENKLQKATKLELINEDNSSKMFRGASYIIIRKKQEKSNNTNQQKQQAKNQSSAQTPVKGLLQFKEEDQNDFKYKFITENILNSLDENLLEILINNEKQIQQQELIDQIRSVLIKKVVDIYYNQFQEKNSSEINQQKAVNSMKQKDRLKLQQIINKKNHRSCIPLIKNMKKSIKIYLEFSIDEIQYIILALAKINFQ